LLFTRIPTAAHNSHRMLSAGILALLVPIFSLNFTKRLPRFPRRGDRITILSALVPTPLVPFGSRVALELELVALRHQANVAATKARIGFGSFPATSPYGRGACQCGHHQHALQATVAPHCARLTVGSIYTIRAHSVILFDYWEGYESRRSARARACQRLGTEQSELRIAGVSVLTGEFRSTYIKKGRWSSPQAPSSKLVPADDSWRDKQLSRSLLCPQERRFRVRQ
jgi:hypothetical protein